MSTLLNVNQQRAVELLASGKTSRAVAGLIGVTPETICRWKREAVFQAALNTLTEDIREAARHRLAAMVEKALEIIADDLQNNPDQNKRVRTAFNVLKLVSHDRVGLPEQPLLTNPEHLNRLNLARRRMLDMDVREISLDVDS